MQCFRRFVLALAAGAVAVEGAGQVVTDQYLWPPPGCELWQTSGTVDFGNGWTATAFVFRFDVGPYITPPPLGMSQDVTLPPQTTGVLNGPGGPMSVNTRSTSTTFINHVADNGPTEFFQTEMLQLDISGGTLPGNIRLRESPTRQSFGSAAYTDLGNGTWRVDSFFDVFVELSIDGGQTWTPGLNTMPLNMQPEPATLASIGLGLALILRRARRPRR